MQARVPGRRGVIKACEGAMSSPALDLPLQQSGARIFCGKHGDYLSVGVC